MKRQVYILCAMGVVLCKFGICGEGTPVPTASDNSLTSPVLTQILKVLPEGARLADDIPLLYKSSSTLETAQTAPPVLSADLKGDGTTEFVVAYYTPPHSYDADHAEEFLSRAHVCIIRASGAGYEKEWDSGGKGMGFRARMGPDLDLRAVNEYAMCYFGVRDINGDGVPDVMFTTTSRSTAADHFEAWSWDGKAFVKIADGPKARLVDLGGNGVMDLVFDGMRYSEKDSAYIARWDEKQFKYVRSEALTKEHKSILR